MNVNEFKDMITFEGEEMKVFRGYQIKEAIESLIIKKKKLNSTVILKGKVKEHTTYKNQKQTVLSRCKVKTF